MGTWNFLWFLTKKVATGALIGITVSDRFASIVSINGMSMHPTLTPGSTTLMGWLKGDQVLLEKFCLDKYEFSHGDIVVFKSPSNYKETCIKRLIALPGDWMKVPETYEIIEIPVGHCWVEGDNAASSLDSRTFGPIPLGLIQGRAVCIIWPPERACKVERRIPEGRISSY
ncbi:hypothetical protein AMTRI_Chr08g159590 [Amborella trichopoda]|uniref:Mitochondrial inner membrane protease subunit 2 n=1 Tax=Amborella trichopoda TaxID=13333 RepID=W1PNZ2_AMBTC|nr:mitochondrial inner membrane protease subunit 2 [Amborella trichopoda]XP_020525176.1 mitochondrial inner membrane protease subunit 2 [Amborella trichopoda]XP_020525177.1 mitochondrial inner membrane protease subunit 2 [Amborella trichopoda]XP_020525178.1 mitochondrial inner membrane protease subunit 2 [Amborella trichopoda]ERN09773.1 hypothetical protein AMTR_s00029p00239390 [Amborella trichopoda]|eukprot:XP_006848192.1 mitochondrial inner membrane protease subunit 2 [Amborella trichopoda]